MALKLGWKHNQARLDPDQSSPCPQVHGLRHELAYVIDLAMQLSRQLIRGVLRTAFESVRFGFSGGYRGLRQIDGSFGIGAVKRGATTRRRGHRPKVSSRGGRHCSVSAHEYDF